MGVAYKNFWSINTDEAVVAGQLRSFLSKNIEIFMPLNAQMKGIDLLAYNHTNGKAKTIQVKGSRAYEPRKAEVDKHGEGSGTWFMFKREVIDKSVADYFIFIHYIIEVNVKLGRRTIVPHFVTMPTNILKEQMQNNGYIVKGSRYALYTWVNPKKKTALGTNNNNIDFTKYLDKSGFEGLMNEIK